MGGVGLVAQEDLDRSNVVEEEVPRAGVVLLVRLHLEGVFWGDCSLSNTLFRRDAGAFAAYLVDAGAATLIQETDLDPAGLAARPVSSRR